MRPLLSLLVLTMSGLTAGGCATAGLALVGPLAGSITAIADRSVERTLPADLATSWMATSDALARMAVHVEQAHTSGRTWRLTATGDAVTVHVTLERVTAGMTRVSMRVEAGGLFADKKTGDELLSQIAASVASLAGAAPSDRSVAGKEVSAEQFRTLQREIEHLGTRIERAQSASPATPRPEPVSAPVPSVAPVITIPASAGLATVPVKHAPLMRPVIPRAASPGPEPFASGGASPVRATQAEDGRADSLLAAPMRSVEVLKPVQGLGARPSGE
jgi:hypothetical protein